MGKKYRESHLKILIRKFIYPFLILLSKTKVKYKTVLLNKYIPIKNKPIIFACNHSAFQDTPIAFKVVKKHCYILAGKQNLSREDKLFFWLAGAIWIDRKDKKQSSQIKDVLVEYLKSKQRILWFPEATWNLTDNSMILQMKWGIVDVAYFADAQIIPMVLDYDREKMICSIEFGNPLVVETLENKIEKINELRNALATLRWKMFERKPILKRKYVDLDAMKKEMVLAVKEYPPLDWEYEKSCIYVPKESTSYENVFAHLKEIQPRMQNAFLFNKRIK